MAFLYSVVNSYPLCVQMTRKSRKIPQPQGLRDFSAYGADGGTRTHTMLPPTDFESVTSTNSITSACVI